MSDLSQNEYTLKSRKWNLPLTYLPKIEFVKRKICTQSIRICSISKSEKHPGELIRKALGDFIRFYIWSARPYRSKRKNITGYMKIVEVKNIIISPEGWGIEIRDTIPWDHPISDMLAKRDGIIPPTGIALRNVLIEKNGPIPAEGIEAQIIRWDP